MVYMISPSTLILSWSVLTSKLERQSENAFMDPSKGIDSD